MMLVNGGNNMPAPDDRADHDWLYPEPPTTDDVLAPKPFAGVWRCDEVDAEPKPFTTLIEATDEPPRSPEAQVYGGGAQLAAAHQDEGVWCFTQAGATRLELEARGLDADAILDVMLGDELRCA
jgi:hypothetical protein